MPQRPKPPTTSVAPSATSRTASSADATTLLIMARRYQKVGPPAPGGGGTGHREAVQIVYDPRRVSYAKLLDVFWHNVDPTDNDGQFCDKGSQYRSAIFYHDETQKRLAEESKQGVVRRLKNVYTDILPASEFYAAEGYHQDYYKKNPIRYQFYRFNCGRDQRLANVWGSAPAH